MNESAILTNVATGNRDHDATARKVVAWAVVVILAGLLALGWMVERGMHSGVDPAIPFTPTVLRPIDNLLWCVLLIVVAGGTGVLGAYAFGLIYWRHSWMRRLRDLDEEWRVKSSNFQRQILLDSRKAEETLQNSEAALRQQLAEQARRTAALQDELDARKQSERTLSVQRQALENSKTVLELHVQASSEEIQKLKRRYELILNSAGEGICGLDLTGRTTFVNPAVARITGWTLEELADRTEKEIFYANGAAGFEELVDDSSGEQSFYRKDGSRFPVEFVRTRIEEHGRPAGSVLIFKDITERKRTEETLAHKVAELGRSNSELEQFAFVASHDLQEPLRKIQAFGDRLTTRLGESLPPEAADYLGRMQGASARMRRLIDDLLTFSRVIRSSEPFVPVDLAQATREALSDLEVRMEKGGGKVEVGDLPTIDADPTQMRQLILNLVGNALKFQKPGVQPLVKVNGRTFNSGSGEPYCELTVQDNGIGFEEQYADKIFAVFQRLHGRTEYEGTGVGLAVCRRIADRHQGTITARSKLGEGATFTVTLPVRQRAKKKAA